MARKPKRSASKESSSLPGPYQQFIQKFPDLGEAHERIASVVEKVATLDTKTCALVKIGICVGAGLESALRSHVRRAVRNGATREEIEQTILLGMNTVGYPWRPLQLLREPQTINPPTPSQFPAFPTLCGHMCGTTPCCRNARSATT